MDEFRVFLSAVTSEFGSARDALAKDLAARNTLVRVQDSFRAEATADTLLRLLHDYVRGCQAVVCVLGTRSGGCLPPAAAAEFREMLPEGITEASYTQWEFFFARWHKRRLSLYRARDDHQPELPPGAGDRPELQAAFLRHIDDAGLHWVPFSSRHELRAEVLKEDWPHKPPDKPIVLPYPSLGTLFKGRDTFLRRLRASLIRPDGGTAAIAGRAVHGLGGVGKTRAAVEYAWAHRADYNALALIDAETPEKLHTGLAALTGPLRLAEHAIPDEAVRMEAALAWLNANPGWFLVLDNVDAEPALDAAHRLLGRLSGGHVVLTSRLARFARGIERLDLDVLNLDDATAFLLEATDTGRRKAANDAGQARTLAEELGQLALALEMAAATIEARGLGFAAYRALWQGNRARVVGWARQAITGYHHAVAETWQTSVDQLTEAGRHLLERLAFLAPDPVPEFLLDVAVPNAAAEDARAALDDLATYSLVTRDLDAGAFVVHRLLQDVTRRGLAAGALPEAVAARGWLKRLVKATRPHVLSGRVLSRALVEALGWVDAAFTGNPQDVRSWTRLDPLATHAEAVARYADAAGIVAPTLKLMGQLDMLFDAKALHARAEIYSRRALAIGEASLALQLQLLFEVCRPRDCLMSTAPE